MNAKNEVYVGIIMIDSYKYPKIISELINAILEMSKFEIKEDERQFRAIRVFANEEEVNEVTKRVKKQIYKILGGNL